MTARIRISGLTLMNKLVIVIVILCTTTIIKSQQPGENILSLEKISFDISLKFTAGDTAGLLALGANYDQIAVSLPDDSFKADLYYFSGVCYLIGANYDKAISSLSAANRIKKSLNIKDDRYLKGIYNLGVAYSDIGDFGEASQLLAEFIEEAEKIYGKSSHDVLSAYSVLIGVLSENKEYDRVKYYTNDVLEILKDKSDILTPVELGDLFHNIGVGYAQTADYAKARIYLERSLEYYKKVRKTVDQNYINLINNLAIVYGYLGMAEKEKEFFEEGIPLAVSDNSSLSFNLINTYAIRLGNEGQADKGERLLNEIVQKAKNTYGPDSRYYINVLVYYAEFIRDYKGDAARSLPLFRECLRYISRHSEDIVLREPVITGYSLALSRVGEPEKALELIQNLLMDMTGSTLNQNSYENPALSSLQTDSRTLKILRSKHVILMDLYSRSGSHAVLESAAGTAELIISLIDRMRISISEEESRIVLGDRYRDLYLTAINDFELCYNSTKERYFLEKIFEYSERCKVAGLLAATRELNAIQFHIPPDIASLEKRVQREIGSLNSKISDENEKQTPDRELLDRLNNRLLTCIQTRDSLVATFEKDFPGYYKIKYDITAPSLKNIPSIVGRNTNYLNYVISDSVLYIFLVNNRHQMFFTQSVDSGFFTSLRRFRILLSDPSTNSEARTEYDEFQSIGYDLYNRLIEPVRKYFISGDLLISPDNLLSYIPFEVLLTSKSETDRILYRELHYLMNDFDISYAYSAAFVEELVNRKMEPEKRLVAFAPVYANRINMDSIFQKRQGQSRYLFDLPYSREEAHYVATVCNGVQYLGAEAKESEYKKIAGNYGIIHLAMHTILNDQNPMNSAMVFTLDNDSPDDGLLYTYEVYGIPLRTRMVVLSSCNTGSGMLSTGEGILSLARGFLYSGSQSVVMSMWEIDDKSGTDVVKMFYDNLKKGRSKSASLKNARVNYLKNASQLRSHPYYWSALIIYGENAPVFTSRLKIFIISSVIFAVTCLAGIYFWRRKYS